jgi:DMSO/TMAO reductase YedYZ molybdopterin-dependent catalytic subunit/glyoxylase-like metal-dependent hydrolase (beta-lactamase superfamily II)/rhodanese-related sulfurtransferase
VIFSQHYLACLSQASYLIGDESTGRAVVVDPRRDVEIYLEEAAAHGLTIERVIETHVHADFLSGHLELAAQTGATISYGEAATVGFPIERLEDGKRVSLGEVTIEILATPGHTPESISIVVYEHADDEVPYGVLTGDTLFVGDVGRPDLLASGEGGISADVLARQLYHSLHEKLLRLPDDTRVFPAHGAGSSCGKQLSTETTSTLGEQRRSNYALQCPSEDEFVAAITEGQPLRPGYFEFDARRNREPHSLLDAQSPPPLDLDEVLARQQAGAVLLDTREPADFAAGHLRGAVNVGLQGRFAEYVGSVLPPDREVVLVGDPMAADEGKLRLGRVGYDRVVGQLDDPGRAYASRPDVVETSSRLTATQLTELGESTTPLQLIDVRSPAETAGGTILGAREIPFAGITDSLSSLDPDAPIVVYCASGYRSQIAASVLRAAGFYDVSDLLGGYSAWEGAGLPTSVHVVHSIDPLNRELRDPSLISELITPNAVFYDRNHFPVPVLDPDTWVLEVGGLVPRPGRLELTDIEALPAVQVVATLECAGNGRSMFDGPIEGEPWRLGAVSTAEWTGIPFIDVLESVGATNGQHVVMRGADHGPVDGVAEPVRYERSMSVDEIRETGALLAFAMNGEPLPPRHGYPLRVVVPGWYGMASVKWLTEIEVVAAPLDAYFQTDRYVYEFERDGVAVRQPVERQRVRSLITDPVDGDAFAAGEFTVLGVAWSGAAPIASVEISIGAGPWQPAALLGEPSRHHWQWWEVTVVVAQPGATMIRARATDAAGETQPGRPELNRLGYGGNAIHTVCVTVR